MLGVGSEARLEDAPAVEKNALVVLRLFACGISSVSPVKSIGESGRGRAAFVVFFGLGVKKDEMVD